MALDQFANFAFSTVAIAPPDTQNGRQLTIASGQGTRFPTPPFNVVVWPLAVTASPEVAEILRVTVKSGDIFTVTRAQENTTVKDIQVGWNISASITAKTLSDISSGLGGTTPGGEGDATTAIVMAIALG